MEGANTTTSSGGKVYWNLERGGLMEMELLNRIWGPRIEATISRTPEAGQLGRGGSYTPRSNFLSPADASYWQKPVRSQKAWVLRLHYLYVKGSLLGHKAEQKMMENWLAWRIDKGEKPAQSCVLHKLTLQTIGSNNNLHHNSSWKVMPLF